MTWRFHFPLCKYDFKEFISKIASYHDKDIITKQMDVSWISGGGIFIKNMPSGYSNTKDSKKWMGLNKVQT